MGLACSQARLLTLTARKADCEYGMSVDSMHRMALTREMSNLSREYNSKLQAKKISYYHNGQYYKMNYDYLMGNDKSWNKRGESTPLKTENSMILTDYKGQVVLSNSYAQMLLKAGVKVDENGRGGTFSKDIIAGILYKDVATIGSVEDYQNVIDKKSISNYSYGSNLINTITGEDTGNDTKTDNTDSVQKKIQAIVDFYYPIFVAAANNGWTMEYNKDMKLNEDYISDALVTGSFQLVTVDNLGNYDERGSLTYFITTGMIQERTYSDEREALTAWYEDEKARISEKETMLDLHIGDLSTELESIKTEIQSIQSLIDDAISSVFDWGGG